jgi:acetolactate synthase regulatory subunit
MTWKFHLLATTQRRLLSRVLQILETQLVSIHSFAGEMSDHGAHITFVVSSEQDKACRIEALLHRLEDVQTISITTES